MPSKIETFVTGLTGLGATEIAQQTISASTDEVSAKVNLVVQILIGIATLFGLFKGGKSKKSKN